jgi:alpha-beta hydrolase superfamily lysophospholipase
MTLEKTSNGKINIIKYPSLHPSDKAVLCIHGFCSDARIFNYFGNQLSKNGFNVYSIDLPGHGNSYGERGDPDFEKCLESINEVVRTLKSTSKVFIIAHSLGCTYALWYAHNFKNSIDGLILLSPYVRIPTIKKRSEIEPSNIHFLYLLLRRLITPRTKMMAAQRLPNFLKVGGQEIQQMMNDKDLNFLYSYRYIVDVLALRNTKIQELSNIDIPLLILHGKKDRNVFPEIGKEFCNLANSKDKKIEILDCDHWFYHAIFYNQTDTKYSDKSRMNLINSIKDWLVMH